MNRAAATTLNAGIQYPARSGLLPQIDRWKKGEPTPDPRRQMV